MKKRLSEKELLEERLDSILYFQSKSNILTMKMEDYLKINGCYLSMIPTRYINIKNKTPEPERPLYVFDFIGIGNTSGVYPSQMDPEMYQKFILSVNEVLSKNGLSSIMVMDDEQRRIFDSLVREKAKMQQIIPQILTSDEWYKLIRRKIYGGLPQQIEQILNKRNLPLVMEITKYVRTKCSNVRLSDNVIEQFLGEALNANNITLGDLRNFDINELRNYRGKIK